MKTIEFEGKKYEVEDWVIFVARDKNGNINGFEKQPERAEEYWRPHGKSVLLYSYSEYWQFSISDV